MISMWMLLVFFMVCLGDDEEINAAQGRAELWDCDFTVKKPLPLVLSNTFHIICFNWFTIENFYIGRKWRTVQYEIEQRYKSRQERKRQQDYYLGVA